MPIPYIVEKPIFEGEGIINIAIRETILKDAIYRHEPIEVIWGDKKAFISPMLWIKTGKLMKKEFRFKDSPMRLWQNTIRFDKPLSETDKLKEIALSTM